MKCKKSIKLFICCFVLLFVCATVMVVKSKRYTLIYENIEAITNDEEQEIILITCFEECHSGINSFIKCSAATPVGYGTPESPIYECGDETTYPNLLTKKGYCYKYPNN